MEDYNKVRIALKTLMSGLPMEVDGNVLRMAQDYDIVQEMDSYSVENGVQSEVKKTYVGTQMTVRHFASLCQKLTTDETMIMAANLALNDM